MGYINRSRINIHPHAYAYAYAYAHTPAHTRLYAHFSPPHMGGGEKMWVHNRAGAYAYEKAGSGIGLFLAANKRYTGERESSPLGRRVVVAVDIPCSR